MVKEALVRNKKKVLVLARWPVGGIRTYFRYIYSQQYFENYAFTFVLPDIQDIETFLDEYILDCEYKVILSTPRNSSLFALALKELNTGGYRLIHAHGFTAGSIALPLQFRFSIPQLLTTHDVFSESNFKGIKGTLKKLAMGMVLRSVTKLMPVGRDAEDNLIKYFPSVKNKTHSIRNGIPTEVFYRAKKRDLKSELGLSSDTFLVGFFGRFMAQKGFRYLVAATKELSKNYSMSEFRVVCFGWGGFIREEQEQLKRLGIEQFFSFMPHTDDMPAAIKGVDLVAMPSLWEACPLLPMEVLSTGTPIVGTSCIGSKEVFENTPAYVVEPKSVDGIVNAVCSEMSNPKIKLFYEFAPRAVKRYSNSVSAKKLEHLYDELI